MSRLSIVISEIYNKYLPLASKNGIELNLDFPDSTQEIEDSAAIKQALDQHLNSAIGRAERGHINISVGKNAIKITDSGTILSKPICRLLSNSHIQVKSRVGFGTTATIFLKSDLAVAKPPKN